MSTVLHVTSLSTTCELADIKSLQNVKLDNSLELYVSVCEAGMRYTCTLYIVHVFFVDGN